MARCAGAVACVELAIDQPLGFLLTLDMFSSRRANLGGTWHLPRACFAWQPPDEKSVFWGGWGHSDPELRKETAPPGGEGPALALSDPRRARSTRS